MRFKRVFVIVCDSMGIGQAKDAYKYNDEQILADMCKCLKEKGICNESVIGE